MIVGPGMRRQAKHKVPVATAIPTNVTLPAINGNPTQGQTLGVSNGAWNQPVTSYAYQWKRAGTAISGATGASYLVASADIGQALTCTVTATNSFGSTPATSTSVTGLSGSPANSVLPVISGIQTAGQVLTVSTGTWTNSPTSYTYQWTKAGSNISGATSATYTIQSGDAGSAIACVVTATNTYGSNTATAASVTPAAALSISGTPTTSISTNSSYSFTPTVAGGHTAYIFNITNQPTWASFSTTTGALTGTTPSANETDSNIVIGVTDANGLTASLAAFTITVAYVAIPPANTAAPTITGVQTQGQVVTANNGTWTNSPTSYTYIWYNAGVAISGATSQTYTLQATDVGAAITVQVTAINGAGSAAATSASITPAATLTISGSPSTTATVSASYSFTPTTAGGHTPKSYQIINMPSWAAFTTATGQLTGTPTATGTFPGITIGVTDNDGLTAWLPAFTITVNPASVTVLNPSTAGTYMVLSNNNLTGANPTGTNDSTVQSVNSHSSGKRVVRYVVNSVPTSTTSYGGVGFGGSLNQSNTWITRYGIGYGWQGGVSAWSGSLSTTLEHFTTGDVLYACVDIDNLLVWFRRNNGYWNNSSTANPDTGTGGLAYSSSIGTPLYAEIGCSDVNESYTIDGTAAGHGLTTAVPWDAAEGARAPKTWSVTTATFASTMSSASTLGGDTVELATGSYGDWSPYDINFTSPVTVRPAAGATVTAGNWSLNTCSYINFAGNGSTRMQLTSLFFLNGSNYGVDSLDFVGDSSTYLTDSSAPTAIGYNGTNSIVINNCTTKYHAGALEGKFCNGLTVTNNTFQFTQTDINHIGADISNFLFQSNFCSNSGATGGDTLHQDMLQMFGSGGSGAAATNISIINNKFVRGSGGGNVQGLFIESDGMTYSNVTITGNMIMTGNYWGMNLDTVTNSKIDGNYIGAFTDSYDNTTTPPTLMFPWIGYDSCNTTQITNNVAGIFGLRDDGSNVNMTISGNTTTTYANPDDLTAAQAWWNSNHSTSLVGASTAQY